MPWSRSKPFMEKWYRIRENEGGRKEILEADHQWAIEKGLGDNYKASFNHYFMVDNNWFAQKDVAYQYLFVDINVRFEHGYKVEPLTLKERFDELFEALHPIQGWVVYLEERINDCEMALEWQLGRIEVLQKQIATCANEYNNKNDQELRQYKEEITECARKIQQLKIEYTKFVVKLRNEEQMEWHDRKCLARRLG
jgi:hypothetical protein